MSAQVGLAGRGRIGPLGVLDWRKLVLLVEGEERRAARVRENVEDELLELVAVRLRRLDDLALLVHGRYLLERKVERHRLPGLALEERAVEDVDSRRAVEEVERAVLRALRSHCSFVISVYSTMRKDFPNCIGMPTFS